MPYGSLLKKKKKMKIFIIKVETDLKGGLLLTKGGEACYRRRVPYGIRHILTNNVAYNLLKQLNLLRVS